MVFFRCHLMYKVKSGKQEKQAGRFVRRIFTAIVALSMLIAPTAPYHNNYKRLRDLRLEKVRSVAGPLAMLILF